MKRRLVKQANQAMTVTLPIGWIRENKLKAGDEIDLELCEKNIIIRTENKSSGGKANFDFQGFDRRKSITYINSAYANGIDELEVKTELDIYNIISQNIGYAIVGEHKCKYTIKDLSGGTTTDLRDIFKRVFQMLITFYESALKDVFYDHKADIQIVSSMDREINKYTFFLQRQIMKHAYDNQSVGRIMFAYSFWLEHLGDLISRLWLVQLTSKFSLNKIDESICALSMKSMHASFQAWYQFNDEIIDDLIAGKAEIRKKIMRSGNSNPAKSMFLNYALKIVEDCADLAHLAIMLHIKKE